MPHYQFDITKDDGTIDHLRGGMDLVDDAAAVNFARRVIRDMLVENPEPQMTATMNVSQAGRAVQSLVLNAPCPSMWN